MRFNPKFALVIAVLCGVAVWTYINGLFLQHWFAIHLGIQYEICGVGKSAAPCPVQPYYNFWSAFGSCISEITLVPAAIIGVMRLNCQTPGCWKWHQRVTPNGHKLCHSCATKELHPDLAPLHESHLTSS